MNLQTIITKIRRWLFSPKYRRSVTGNIAPYVYDQKGRGADITSYKSTKDIFKSGRFTAEERRREYRRRGKSPSGVIDGVYNDMYLENGASYNDVNRDWDADA